LEGVESLEKVIVAVLFALAVEEVVRRKVISTIVDVVVERSGHVVLKLRRVMVEDRTKPQQTTEPHPGSPLTASYLAIHTYIPCQIDRLAVVNIE
jgi:hypothetical protein